MSTHIVSHTCSFARACCCLGNHAEALKPTHTHLCSTLLCSLDLNGVNNHRFRGWLMATPGGSTTLSLRNAGSIGTVKAPTSIVAAWRLYSSCRSLHPAAAASVHGLLCVAQLDINIYLLEYSKHLSSSNCAVLICDWFGTTSLRQKSERPFLHHLFYFQPLIDAINI